MQAKWVEPTCVRQEESSCKWFSLSFPKVIYEKPKDSTHLRGCSAVRTRHGDRTQGAQGACEASTPWPSDTLAPKKPLWQPRKAGIISDPQFKRSHAITLKAMVQLFGCLPQSSNMIKAKVSVLAPTDYRIVTAWHGGN